MATRGKSSMGWFYGFKLHAIINHKGELVSVKVTAGNTDDRAPVKDMATPVFGKLFGDRGYISKALNEWLTKHSDTTLITKLRRNMKPQVLKPMDEALLIIALWLKRCLESLKTCAKSNTHAIVVSRVLSQTCCQG